MSWLKTTSLSFARQLSRSLDPRHDYEPQACYNSFCKHWQQAYDIILKSKPQNLHDDVLAVVNHLEQLATLLVLEAKAREISTEPAQAACLEHLLSENLLDKLYEWVVCTGRYENAVRLEELKLFGHLIAHYGSQVIAAEPFLRPLLKLLSGFRNQLPPPNLESQLVSVLNQLCVALMQNIRFIDLFFLTAHTESGSHAEFIITRLLLPCVHRGGATGACARDALLLCAHMSARCEPLAQRLLADNTGPVLATGLSGLYSLLPRTLGDKVYRLTPDDVNRVHKLTLFIDSLEFCNAVAQVAHPSIKKHLLDLLYQGFLVPVMGPALLQSGTDEQAAAMAYLELILRCSTKRGALRSVLHFLFKYEYDGVKVIDVMLGRLEGNCQLSLVSLSLMETLIDLNCEDVMFELVYKYLLNGHHLMSHHRHKIRNPQFYRDSAISFLSISPKCCSRPLAKTRELVEELALSGRRVLELRRDERVGGVNGEIAMDDLVQEIRFNYGNPNESLYGNYHAYLCDARFEIVSRTINISNWSSKYDAIFIPKRETNNNREKEIETNIEAMKEQDSLISICTSGYDTQKTSDTSEKEPHSLTSLTENLLANELNRECNFDSLVSFDESTYDSLRERDDDMSSGFAEESFVMSFEKVDCDYEGSPTVRNWKASVETIIGPLLSSLLKKAGALLDSDVTVNCRVTAVISKLSSLPTELLMSLLLCPAFVLQPNVPSLFKILSKLKEELDELMEDISNTGELVDKARVFLVKREMALLNTRAPPNEDGQQTSNSPAPQDSALRRTETKRRSLSTSISNMFQRRSSTSSPSQTVTYSLHASQNASPQKRLVFTQEEYWNQSVVLRSILNAVILDEWLRELAALCEEHALRLSADNYEDDSFIRTVAL